MSFIMILLSVYGDQVTTIYSIFVFDELGQNEYADMTRSLFIFTLVMRMFNNWNKVSEKNASSPPITMIEKILRFLMYFYPIFSLDILIPSYEILIEMSLEKSVLVAIFDISVLMINCDNIPHSLISLYSQISNDTITWLIMLSTLTSTLSLARNISNIIFNPFEGLSEQINNKFRNYDSSGIVESIVEVFQTYIDLLSRICILAAFGYATRPWGAWVFFGVVASFFGGFILGQDLNKMKKIDILFKYFSGVFLVAVNAKATRFHHFFVDYSPHVEKIRQKDERVEKFIFRGLSLIENNYTFLKLYRLVTISIPIIFISVFYNNLAVNTLGVIVFCVGVICLGLTIINHILDYRAIAKMEKQEKFLLELTPDAIILFAKLLESYPKLKDPNDMKKAKIIKHLATIIAKNLKGDYKRNIIKIIYDELSDYDHEKITYDLVLHTYQTHYPQITAEARGKKLRVEANEEVHNLSKLIKRLKDTEHIINIFEFVMLEDKTLPLSNLESFEINKGELLYSDLHIINTKKLDNLRFSILMNASKELTSISLDLKDCAKTKEIIKELTLCFEKNQKMTGIDLKFDSKKAGLNSTENLLSAIGKLNKLQVFKLTIFDPYDSQDQILKIIQNNPDITTFHLSLDTGKEIDDSNPDKFAENILKDIKAYKFLKDISLEIKNSNVSKDSFMSFVDFLMDLNSILTIKLDLANRIGKTQSECSGINSSIISDTLSVTSESSPENSLIVDNLTNDYIEKLSEKLERKTSLLDYSITYNNTSLNSNDTILRTLNPISFVSNFKHLSLTILPDYNLVDSKELETFVNMLSYFEKLHYFNIDLRQNDSMLNLIMIKKVVEWKKLTHLTVKAKDLTNKNLKEFSETLRQMINLRSLSLDISESYQLNDTGLEDLLTALYELEYLETLKLRADSCPALTKLPFDRKKIEDPSTFSLLKHLSLSFGNCSNLKIDNKSELAHVLASFKLLQSLELNFSESKQCTLNLLQSLENLTNLTRLSLNFSQENLKIQDDNHINKILRTLEIQDELTNLKKLFNTFNYLTAMEHLILDLGGRSYIKDSFMNELLVSWPANSKLKSIYANFGVLCKSTGIKLMNSSLNHPILTNLTNLSLKFIIPRDNNRRFKDLMAKIKKMPKITDLDINLNSKQINDFSPASKAIIALNDLRSLKLECSGQIENSIPFLKALCDDCLKELKTLETLGLDFHNSNLKSDDVVLLKNSLAKMKNLKNIDLNLYFRNYKEDKVNFVWGSEISEGFLGKLRGLRRLELTVCNYSLTDSFFQAIDTTIESSNLDVLSLTFKNCWTSNLEKRILPSIITKTGLTSLNLSFKGINTLNPESDTLSYKIDEILPKIDELWRSLEALVALRELSIDLEGTPITFAELKTLTQTLPKIKNLKNLSLNLENCTRLEDCPENSCNFMQNITEISGLTRLDLNMKNCDELKIFKNSKISLLKLMSNLNHITLMLNGNTFKDYKICDDLKELVDHKRTQKKSLRYFEVSLENADEKEIEMLRTIVQESEYIIEKQLSIIPREIEIKTQV